MSRNLDKKQSYQKDYYKKNKQKLLAYRKDFYENNKQTVIQRSKEWAEKNPEQRKSNYLRSTYGITVEDYNLLYAKQKGCCAGCNRHQSELNKSLGVDHCHTTGIVRGLLCNKCNLAVGYVNDSIQILENLIKYLRNE